MNLSFPTKVIHIHPIFQDGNKRQGLNRTGAATLLFLQLNGYDLVVDDSLFTDFVLSVASGEQSLEQVHIWFREYVSAL